MGLFCEIADADTIQRNKPERPRPLRIDTRNIVTPLEFECEQRTYPSSHFCRAVSGAARRMRCGNITPMQLRSAMLYVKDLVQMKRFYIDLLGVESTNQNSTNEWALFDAGCVRFALHAIPAQIAQQIEIASPPLPRETNPVKLIFEVVDVEREKKRLESMGIRTLRRPWQQPGEACDAVDPEGNIFQLCAPGVDALC